MRSQANEENDGYLEWEGCVRLSDFPGQDKVWDEIDNGPIPPKGKKYPLDADGKKITGWVKPDPEEPAENLRIHRAKIKPILHAIQDITGYLFMCVSACSPLPLSSSLPR